MMNGKHRYFEVPPADLPAVVQEFERVRTASPQPLFLERLLGWSGYEWQEKEGAASVSFAPVADGFAIHRKRPEGEDWLLYGEDGAFLAATRLAPQPLLVPQHVMEVGNPVVSHLFNLLSYEYAQARTGDARCMVVASVESALRLWGLKAKPHPKRLWSDPAITRFWAEALRLERTSVLRWRERQRAIDRLYGHRKEILEVKQRVWQRGFVWMLVALVDFWISLRRFGIRPKNNLQGLSRLLTIDVFSWFFRTVRNNIGYSIALAIYGPFTFYFITQPLNPKAMWAVGKVRETYLDVSERVSGLISSTPHLGSIATPSVSGAVAVASSAESTPAPPPAASQQIDVASLQSAARAWQERLGRSRFAHLGFPVTTDFPEADTIPWQERMSHFKGLQIALEERMVFAARMGRIEQIESQLVFPITVRGAWREMTSYLRGVDAKVASVADGPARAAWERERARADRARLYVWDKLLRFNRDYQFIVMDVGHEHQYKDRLLGEPLYALVDLTRDLQHHLPHFQPPAGFDDFERLATSFRRGKSDGASRDPLQFLQSQSALFAQKDPFDGFEYRSYMARQWEILYLLQNKAQEASNFGLMAYTGSIRNAIYSLQSLYAQKSRDLFSPEADADEERSSNLAYVSILNLLQADLVSIGPELAERLPLDLDFAQRKKIIEDVKGFIADRELLAAHP